MAAPFPKLTKGKTPTLLDVALAQKVLDFLNGLSKATVTPNGAGTFIISDTGTILDLSGLMNQLVNLQAQINLVQRGLQNATITCNADGTITFTPGN
jgi:hypothetical protein